MSLHTLPKIGLATLASQTADPEIAVESEMHRAHKLHGAQT